MSLIRSTGRARSWGIRLACALAALLPITTAAGCDFSVPLLNSSFFECPDRPRVAAYAYVLGAAAEANSGTSDIVCEAFNGVTCYGATGVAGDGVADIEADWGNPGMVGCPYASGTDSPRRIVLVAVGSDGSGLVLSMSGLTAEFQYSLDVAYPLTPDAHHLMPLYCDARSARPLILGADAGLLTLQFSAPSVVSDCDPGSLGQVAFKAGLIAQDPCGDHFAAEPEVGSIYTSLQPCGVTPDIRKDAWTPSGIVPDGAGRASLPYTLPADPATCLYVGGTVRIAGEESAAITGFAQVGPTPLDAPPTVSVIASPSSGVSPLLVKIDASGSFDGDQSPIVEYTFDFGDGSRVTKTTPIVSHTFGTGGFVITVRVTDAAGLTTTVETRVDVSPPGESAPAAVLTASPLSGQAPLMVTFDASGSTDPDATPISTYLFDFGDGSAPWGPTGTPSIRHTYLLPGLYTARVTVTDTAGLNAAATASVTVGPADEAAPTPVLRMTPSQGSPPLSVMADASASRDLDATPIATYQFDFGDGSLPSAPQSSPLAQHIYTSVGAFTARVIVTDRAGLSARATAY
ncbi:MAG TPA: PKD domain-containing protein, partial [Candidatus Polarisedimenticolia bacterium]